MFKIFKSKAVESENVLLGNFHIVAIFREDVLIEKWKKEYKPPTSWKRFIANKSRRNNFNQDYLDAIKQILYGLNYYMKDLGDCVYYNKDMPLFIHIDKDWFIGIAPMINGVDC